MAHADAMNIIPIIMNVSEFSALPASTGYEKVLRLNGISEVEREVNCSLLRNIFLYLSYTFPL